MPNSFKIIDQSSTHWLASRKHHRTPYILIPKETGDYVQFLKNIPDLKVVKPQLRYGLTQAN